MKLLLRIFAVLIGVYAIYSWYRIVTTSAPDFSVFYGAAQQLISHHLLYGQSIGFTLFNYPPQTVLFFFPLLLLSYPVAQTIFVTGSLLLIPFIGWITLRLFNEKISWDSVLLVSSLLFLSFPTKFTIAMGQVNIYALSILLIGLLLIQKKRLLTGGMVIGISLLLKPQSIILIIPFLLLGRWKEIWGVGAVWVLATAVLVLFFGFTPLMSYVKVDLPIVLQFSGRDVYFNQSLSSFLSRILPLMMAEKISILGSVSFLGTAIWIVQRKKPPLLPSVLFFLPVFLLIQPLTWQHHVVYLFPSFLYIWIVMKDDIHRSILLISAGLVSMNIVHPEFYSDSLLLRATWLSHVFWGMILLYFLWIEKYSSRN